LEVAHRLAFGYGHLTWEWGPRESGGAIRGWTHPLIFAAVYRALAVLGLDSSLAVIYVPRVVQALFAAWADVGLYRLSLRACGPLAAQCTLICSLGSWFVFYCGIRTFSNSLEAQLAIVSLCFWALPGIRDPKTGFSPQTNRAIAVALASLSIVIRPTAAVFWAPVVLAHLWHVRCTSSPPSLLCAAAVAAFQIAPIGIVIVGLGTAIDSILYGRFTFVPLDFGLRNIGGSVAGLYGVHPWHWYFT
jgi:phosphatidylinositol glycan class B